MNYFIQGGGALSLSDADFVAEGGEGRVYAQGGETFKIYHDPAKMVPPAKLQQLGALDRLNIVRPRRLVLNAQHQPVGFSMARVERGVALPRLFGNDYRAQQQIDEATVAGLLENMQETIVFIHDRRCLMVDGNEMNYLVREGDWRTAYFIDVDSYQTPGFPATAIMPSIRDYHAKNFSPLSDWFAFAIVACQLWLGIHPYKGKHPQFKKANLEARMRANVSIFNPDTSLPAAVRDFSLIPPAFYDWFVRLFERGERLPPPLLAGAVSRGQARSRVVQGGAHFIVTLLREYPEPVRRVTAWQGVLGVFAGNRLFLGEAEIHLPQPDARLLFSPRSAQPLLAWGEAGHLRLARLPGLEPVEATLRAEALVQTGNHLYAAYQDNLTELKLSEYGDKLVASAGTAWKIMPNSSQVLDGLVYENVLGRAYLVLPYRNPGGHSACLVRAIPELDGYKIVSGQHQGGVVMLVGHRDGRYDRLCLRFDPAYARYRCTLETDVEQTELNFAVLDNGVVVNLVQDGELELSSRLGDGVKLLRDPQLRGDMRLRADGARVLFQRERGLYWMRMK